MESTIIDNLHGADTQVESEELASAEPTPGDQSSPSPQSIDLARLGRLANDGNAAALSELRRRFREQPQLAMDYGDVGTNARRYLISRITNGDKLLSLAYEARCEQMSEKLLPADPEMLVRQAVQRLILAWLEANDIRMRIGGTHGPATMSELSRRQAHAEKQYTESVKSYRELVKPGKSAK